MNDICISIDIKKQHLSHLRQTLFCPETKKSSVLVMVDRRMRWARLLIVSFRNTDWSTPGVNQTQAGKKSLTKLFPTTKTFQNNKTCAFLCA